MEKKKVWVKLHIIVGRNREYEMVTARQFEVSECKTITTEKEMIMEVLAKVEMVRVFEC